MEVNSLKRKALPQWRKKLRNVCPTDKAIALHRY